jgi:hypothetical protein
MVDARFAPAHATWHQPSARKPNRRVELGVMAQTVESLTAEIGQIVAERQELRAAGASFDVLEENRRRLAKAQSELSQLLIARYLPSSQTA